jgi:hypothetical protein
LGTVEERIVEVLALLKELKFTFNEFIYQAFSDPFGVAQ